MKAARPVAPAQRVSGGGKSSAARAKGKPHLPGGRVPEALSAIAMKALALHRDDRYQTVEAFQADLSAYQGGFATSAERAGLGRQLSLLVQRNRALAACAAVFFVLINAFGVTVLVSQRHIGRGAGAAPRHRAHLSRAGAEPRQ